MGGRCPPLGDSVHCFPDHWNSIPRSAMMLSLARFWLRAHTSLQSLWGQCPACFVHSHRPTTQARAWHVVGTQQIGVEHMDEWINDKPTGFLPELDCGKGKEQL